MLYPFILQGRHGRVRMVVGLKTTYIQSMFITTKVVSSNPARGDVYAIQHYVIKFVSHLGAGHWFSPDIPVSSTNKTDLHDITEILLKVQINTVILTLTPLLDEY